MNKSMRKIQKILKQKPSITSSEDEVEQLTEGNLNGSTTETNSTKTNTFLSILSNFSDEIFPTVNPANTIMSVIPRNFKVVSKSTALPVLFTVFTGTRKLYQKSML